MTDKKAKGAKPVKAWGIYGIDGRLVGDPLVGQAEVYRERPPRRDLRPGERAVRVLVTPLESKP